MNGRIYAPQLGRMLSPDPVTQAPDNGQNYNRYSYAFNNPLKYTDPNGYEAATATTIVANEIANRLVNGLVDGLLDSLFGGKSCDAACLYTRQVNQWCYQIDCTGQLSQAGTIEDVEFNRTAQMNRMTATQAFQVAQVGDQSTSNGEILESTDVIGQEEPLAQGPRPNPAVQFVAGLCQKAGEDCADYGRRIIKECTTALTVYGWDCRNAGTDQMLVCDSPGVPQCPSGATEAGQQTGQTEGSGHNEENPDGSSSFDKDLHELYDPDRYPW